MHQQALLTETEKLLQEWKHPDPYTPPTAPGGMLKILRAEKLLWLENAMLTIYTQVPSTSETYQCTLQLVSICPSMRSLNCSKYEECQLILFLSPARLEVLINCNGLHKTRRQSTVHRPCNLRIDITKSCKQHFLEFAMLL